VVNSAAGADGGPDKVRLTVWVHGRVQGVGMRWWIRARALEHGLCGWARNTEDGRVEVVAEGLRAGAEQFLSSLHEGAGRPGQVTQLTERWSQARGGLSGFVER
jgi:acylphosphatase